MRIHTFFKTGIEKRTAVKNLLLENSRFIRAYTQFFVFSLIGLFHWRGLQLSYPPPLSLDPLIMLYMFDITVQYYFMAFLWPLCVVSSSCLKNSWSTPNTWLSDHNQLIIMILHLSWIFKISHALNCPNLIK